MFSLPASLEHSSTQAWYSLPPSLCPPPSVSSCGPGWRFQEGQAAPPPARPHRDRQHTTAAVGEGDLAESKNPATDGRAAAERGSSTPSATSVKQTGLRALKERRNTISYIYLLSASAAVFFLVVGNRWQAFSVSQWLQCAASKIPRFFSSPFILAAAQPFSATINPSLCSSIQGLSVSLPSRQTPAQTNIDFFSTPLLPVRRPWIKLANSQLVALKNVLPIWLNIWNWGISVPLSLVMQAHCSRLR